MRLLHLHDALRNGCWLHSRLQHCMLQLHPRVHARVHAVHPSLHLVHPSLHPEVSRDMQGLPCGELHTLHRMCQGRAALPPLRSLCEHVRTLHRLHCPRDHWLHPRHRQVFAAANQAPLPMLAGMRIRPLGMHSKVLHCLLEVHQRMFLELVVLHPRDVLLSLLGMPGSLQPQIGVRALC